MHRLLQIICHYRLLLVAVVLLSFKSVHHYPAPFVFEPRLLSIVNKGDIIFREGTAYESAVIKSISHGAYSHVGIITQVYPHISIVHATTNDNPANKNQVIRSSLMAFTSPTLAKNWAIIRLNNLAPQLIDDMVDNIEQQLGRSFNIDVRENPHLYCTTLIADELPADIYNNLHWQQISVPGLKGELLFPKAFLEIDNIQTVYSTTP